MLPFGTLAVLLVLGPYLPLPSMWAYPLRTLAVLAVLLLFSRRVIDLRCARPVASVAAGAAVFVLWIGPDLLFPEYRSHWLFHNAFTGGALPPVAPGLRTSVTFLLFRAGGSALVVPFAEELFWRAWMMRRLISRDFGKIPLGTYAPQAFWLTAVLFASEHGMYWDVGLVAGAIYNGWMVRTRRLGDCILAHAVTNGLLAAYVILFRHWQYWL